MLNNNNNNDDDDNNDNDNDNHNHNHNNINDNDDDNNNNDNNNNSQSNHTSKIIPGNNSKKKSATYTHSRGSLEREHHLACVRSRWHEVHLNTHLQTGGIQYINGINPKHHFDL